MRHFRSSNWASQRRLRVAHVLQPPWRYASVVVPSLATIASVALVVGCSNTASISQPTGPSGSKCQTALTGVPDLIPPRQSPQRLGHDDEGVPVDRHHGGIVDSALTTIRPG